MATTTILTIAALVTSRNSMARASVRKGSIRVIPEYCLFDDLRIFK